MRFPGLSSKRPAGGFAVRFPYAYSLFAILFLTTIHSPLATILYAADPGIEFGAADDLSVMGVEGGSADPDVEIKGFTVFGSTQASYPGAVTGPGNVVVNGYLSVSSGAYFAADSTFTAISVSSVTTAGAGVIFSTNAYFMNGDVGIGTTAPRTRLELGNDGAVLAIGSYGAGWTEPSLGAGTRMMWYPRKAAFRAGYVAGTQWDNSQIGDHSIAMGPNSRASGEYAVAIGGFTYASGNTGSVALGFSAAASGISSIALGACPT